MRASLVGNVSIAPGQNTAQLQERVHLTGSEPQASRHVPQEAVHVLGPVTFFLDTILETVQHQLAPFHVHRIGY